MKGELRRAQQESQRLRDSLTLVEASRRDVELRSPDGDVKLTKAQAEIERLGKELAKERTGKDEIK